MSESYLIAMPKVSKIVLWFLLSVLLGCIGLLIGLRSVVPGPTSKAALAMNPGEVLAEKHNLPATDGFLVLLSVKQGNPGSEQLRQAVSSLVALLREQTSQESGDTLFSVIQTPFSGQSLKERELQSSDGRHVVVIAQGRKAVYASKDDLRMLPDRLKRWQEKFPQLDVGYLSNATGEAEVMSMIASDLDRSLLYTIPCTILILLWAFRSIAAVAIPLLVACVSLIASLGISAVLSHVLGPISATASQLVVLLVLAVGVDYSLFFITRAREELVKGGSIDQCIQTARQTTGEAIFWCGIVVSVSLSGLFLMQDTVLQSMALVSIISVLYTLGSCLLTLPLLVFLFPSSLRISAKDSVHQSYFWTRLSLKFPASSLALVTAALAWLSSFAGEMHLGNTMIPSILPKSLQSIATHQVMEKHFPDLLGGDITLLLSGDALDEFEQAGNLESLLAELNSFGLHGPLKSEVSNDLKAQRYKFVIDSDGNDRQTRELISSLSEKWLPEKLSGTGIEAFFSGIVPYAMTESQRYTRRLPIVLTVVLALSFFSLVMAFHSLVIPLKAIILNLISTGASFGIMVFVFQLFPGSALYYGVIESFVPPLLFTILFGLSMDYHIYVLSRVTEEYKSSGDPREAVQKGISETSKTITSAALIMISVFLVAATLELPVMKQLGIGLAAAVLIDATLIRSILLPSSMILLGRYNWFPASIAPKH